LSAPLRDNGIEARGDTTMRQIMDDKRIRYLLIAALVVVVALGVLNIISTAFSLLVPLAVIAVGGFAFYKIALEGRDSGKVMTDEVAETSGIVLDDASGGSSDVDSLDDSDDESAARERLSAIARAQNEFFDASTPAEEILDQIQARKQRLTGADDG